MDQGDEVGKKLRLETGNPWADIARQWRNFENKSMYELSLSFFLFGVSYSFSFFAVKGSIDCGTILYEVLLEITILISKPDKSFYGKIYLVCHNSKTKIKYLQH